MDRNELIMTTATELFKKAMETNLTLELNTNSGEDTITEMGKKFGLLVKEIAVIHDSIPTNKL